MTIAELERKLNFSNGQIRRWQKANPNAEHLRAIADYFDVSVDYLLGRNKNEYEGETNFEQLLNQENSFFREVTEEYNLSSADLEELNEDMEAYLKMRASLLKKKKGD